MKTGKNQFKDHVISRGRLFLSTVLITGLFITAISCSDDDDDEPEDVFTATLTGGSENPPNESEGMGTAILTYNTETRIFNIVVEYSGVEATGAHIHEGAEDVNGPVVFGFSPPITSPINYTSEPLTAAQEANLYNGMYYVNIHSQTYPGGEIRGELTQD